MVGELFEIGDGVLDGDGEEGAVVLNVVPDREAAVVALLHEHAVEAIERVDHEHPRVAVAARAAQIPDAEAVVVTALLEDELDEAVRGIHVDDDRVAGRERVALDEEAREHVSDRRLAPARFFLAHAVLFAWMPAVAQAEPVTDRGFAPFVGFAVGRQLASEFTSPLSPAGARQTVEAGVSFDGGFVFDYEIGLRAVTADGPVTSGIGAFGGVRIDLSARPWWDVVVPVLRGGLGLMHVRPEERLTAGPHFDVGLAVRVHGFEIVVAAAFSAWVAPFVVDLGGRISLVGARF